MQTSQVYPQAAAGLPAGGRRLRRALVDIQVSWSRAFDRLLPRDFRADGNRDFIDRLVPQYLTAGAVVYDVGGGKNPIIGRERKSALALKVTGLDIDAAELAAAPPGLYDRTVCQDISSCRGSGDADLVVCQALLEHVPDTRRALDAIAGILRPGGRALIFVPSRNAVYAHINRILPQRLKRRILFAVFPGMSRDHGFPAWYDRCTPGQLDRLAGACRLVRDRRLVYFQSDYFRFCFPLHAVWRLWLVLFRLLAGDEAAETFSVVYRKLP